MATPPDLSLELAIAGWLLDRAKTSSCGGSTAAEDNYGELLLLLQEKGSKNKLSLIELIRLKTLVELKALYAHSHPASSSSASSSSSSPEVFLRLGQLLHSRAEHSLLLSSSSSSSSKRQRTTTSSSSPAFVELGDNGQTTPMPTHAVVAALADKAARHEADASALHRSLQQLSAGQQQVKQLCQSILHRLHEEKEEEKDQAQPQPQSPTKAEEDKPATNEEERAYQDHLRSLQRRF